MKAKLTTINLLERVNFVNKFTLFRSVSLGVLVVMNLACQKDIELADRSKRVEYFPWGISSWSIVNEDGTRAQLFQVEVTRIADPNHRRISLHLENTIGSKCTSQNLEIDEKSPTTTDEDKNEWVIADFSGNSENCYLKNEANLTSIPIGLANGSYAHPSRQQDPNYIQNSKNSFIRRQQISGPINFGSKNAIMKGSYNDVAVLLDISKGTISAFSILKNIVFDKVSDASYVMNKDDFETGLKRIIRNSEDSCYEKQNSILMIEYVLEQNKQYKEKAFYGKSLEQSEIDTIFLKAFNKIKKETTYPCDNGGYL